MSRRRSPLAATMLVAAAAIATACTHDFGQFEPGGEDASSTDGGAADGAQPKQDGAIPDAAGDAASPPQDGAPPADAAGSDASCVPDATCLQTAQGCSSQCQTDYNTCVAACKTNGCKTQCALNLTSCKQACVSTCTSCTSAHGCSAAATCAQIVGP